MQREQRGQSLQATALVHSLPPLAFPRRYVLGKSWQFLAVAPGPCGRFWWTTRGGERIPQPGSGEPAVRSTAQDPDAKQSQIDILALDDALDRLERLNPQHSRIIELRYFAGMSFEEIAAEDELAILYTTLRSALSRHIAARAESEKTLRGTIEQAGKRHLTRIELEARIKLARLHRDLHNRSAAAQEIEAIEQQAKVRGYVRLTRETASLRGSAGLRCGGSSRPEIVECVRLGRPPHSASMARDGDPEVGVVARK